MAEKTLPKWFLNRLHAIMKHNDYTEEMITVQECDKQQKWTPTDLILREYYNNGGGSSKGFLGITCAQCIKCFDYIKENQKMLQEMDFYSEKGFNNWGFPLWNNYLIH